MVTIPRAEYEGMRAQIDWLMEQLSFLFNEAEVYADEEKSEPTPVAAHVRHKRSGSVRDIVPERSIKPFVISRKNFLFASTPGGVKASAVLFSLIETAKENGLNPYKYLTWALEEASRKPAAELVPWKFI